MDGEEEEERGRGRGRGMDVPSKVGSVFTGSGSCWTEVSVLVGEVSPVRDSNASHFPSPSCFVVASVVCLAWSSEVSVWVTEVSLERSLEKPPWSSVVVAAGVGSG